MKSVVIHRIAVAMSLLLLIAGVVAYLYLRHSQTYRQPLFFGASRCRCRSRDR